MINTLLKKERHKLKLTTYQVAENLWVSQSYIAKTESWQYISNKKALEILTKWMDIKHSEARKIILKAKIEEDDLLTKIEKKEIYKLLKI